MVNGISTLLRGFMPIVLSLILGSIAAYFLVPYELEQMKWEIPGMPESYPIEQKMRPILLLLLCFLPLLGTIIYRFMGTMDRYMSRHFIVHFLLCTLILVMIYIIADSTDNMERFSSRFDDPLRQSLIFYAMQMPMFLYQILPYTLLMGALWSLSRWSSTCELTGMLQSGRSLMRVCAPIFIFGSLIALVYGIFGFHWAPSGSLYRDLILKQEVRQDGSSPALIYKHERSSRIWYIESPANMQNPGEAMMQVEIKQFDPQAAGRVLHQLRADKAQWDKMTSRWNFSNVYIRKILSDDVSRPQDDEFYPILSLDYEEKPYQILSPSQNRGNDSLSTSALYDLISSGAGTKEERARKRTEWHVRIARIFTCIILLFLALPSAVTFQRRGAMKGIGIAIILAALMLFFYRVFPTLGESRIIQAWLSAWIPNIIYLFITCWLYQKNLAHRSFKEWLVSLLKRPATASSHDNSKSS